jgi:hypothetical protein
MTKRILDRIAVAALSLSLALLIVVRTDAGQAPPEAKPAPTLSVEQKQGITILAQRIELAQLRAQAAQAEFDKARGELSTLLQSLKKDGFDLDLQTMQYVKKPDPPKADGKK